MSSASVAPGRLRDVVDRVATIFFCLAALSFGWWLGGGGLPGRSSPETIAAPAPAQYFECDPQSGCDGAYTTYLETEKARALAWRHGGP